MDRCSPVEMRKNLSVVESYRSLGIDFIAVPVRDDDHKNKLLAEGNEVLNKFLEDIES